MSSAGARRPDVGGPCAWALRGYLGNAFRRGVLRRAAPTCSRA